MMILLCIVLANTAKQSYWFGDKTFNNSVICNSLSSAFFGISLSISSFYLSRGFRDFLFIFMRSAIDSVLFGCSPLLLRILCLFGVIISFYGLATFLGLAVLVLKFKATEFAPTIKTIPRSPIFIKGIESKYRLAMRTFFCFNALRHDRYSYNGYCLEPVTSTELIIGSHYYSKPLFPINLFKEKTQ